MTKRTGKAGATHAGNGGSGGTLAEALTPLIAGMTATRFRRIKGHHELDRLAAALRKDATSEAAA